MEYRPQKLLDINIALCQNCQNKLLLASSYGYFCLVPYYLPADSSTQHTCYLVLLNTTLGPHGGRGASSFLRTELRMLRSKPHGRPRPLHPGTKSSSRTSLLIIESEPSSPSRFSTVATLTWSRHPVARVELLLLACSFPLFGCM